MPSRSNPYSIAMIAACPFPANHGSPASIREMSETLARSGHRIHILTYPHGQDLPVDQRIRVHRCGGFRKPPDTIRVGPTLDKPFLDFLLLIRLCRVIRREGIQLIHAHNYEGALIGIAAKWITGIPLLYNAVNTMSDELPGYRFIRPAFLARRIARFLDWFVPIFPDHITAVSQDLLTFLLQQGVPAERLSLVPAGVVPEMFEKADPDKVRRRYPIGSSPVVMYTGTLDPFQRPDYLLKAFSIVARAEPKALLMIVSNIVEPTYLKAYQEQARSLGLSERVLWIGPHLLEDLPDYLAAAAVTVVPRPDCPGHPVKLLNYMAAGKPIVCSAGSAKGIRHGVNGIVVPDHDWDAMGKAILALLRDDALARRLGDQARRTLREEYTWEALCRKIEGIYRDLIPREN